MSRRCVTHGRGSCGRHVVTQVKGILKVKIWERYCSKKGFKKGNTCRGGACTDVGNVHTPKEPIQMESSRHKEERQCTNEYVRWLGSAL